MARPIIQAGDPLLRLRARKVSKVNDSVRALIKEMLDVVQNEDGVGLAAPQIGVPLRIAVLKNTKSWLTIINPEVIEPTSQVYHYENKYDDSLKVIGVYNTPKVLTVETLLGVEACLSVKGFAGNVKRKASISIRYQDERGVSKKLHAEGYLARIVQHELDHLNGVLIIDKLEIETPEVKTA